MDTGLALRQKILHPTNLRKVGLAVVDALGRGLYADEANYIKNTMNEWRYDKFVTQTPEAIIGMISDNVVRWAKREKFELVTTDAIDSEIYKQLRESGDEYAPPAANIDREILPERMLKKYEQHAIIAPSQKLDQYQLRMLFIREKIIGSSPIFVDTRNRSVPSFETNGSPINIFRFNLNTDGYVSHGSVTTTVALRDIVRMRVSRLSIPYVPQIQDASNIALTLEQLTNTAYIASNGNRSHFPFTRSVVENNRVNLLPEFDGTFSFDRPVTGLNDFTIAFYSPTEQVSFAADRDTVGVSNIYTGNTTTIVTNFQHKLATNDLVIFSGFATTDESVYGNTSTKINNPLGLRVSVLTATSFSVAVDTSDPGLFVSPGTQLACFFVSKRISFYLSFDYIRPFDSNM